MEQGPLAGRPNTRDFLQPGLAQVSLAPYGGRADREPVRLVAQSLNKIEHRVAWLELERFAARHEEGLHAGIPIGPLGNCDQRNVHDAKSRERFLRRHKLTASAVDND